MNRPALTLAAVALFAVAFLYGVLHLFALRFAEGDVYPPYSTLRADPLGAKALHDALGALPGVEVARNFRPLPRLQPPGAVTLVYAGIGRFVYWQPKELETFEALVRGGSHAVFTFLPVDRPPRTSDEESAESSARERKQRAVRDERKQSAGKREEKEKEKDEEEEPLLGFDKVAKTWGFSFAWLPAPKEKAFARTALAVGTDEALEPEISWHSALYFKDLAPEWQPLYTSDGQPVVVERKFGKGTIVLAGDSYFLSNEALRRERQPQLLGRIFGGPASVVFDEEHHGVVDQPGIAQLARKYGLHGAVAVLALLAALFVWKSTARFLPPRADAESAGDVVTGKEAAEGFVHLLQRSIKPADVLAVCVEEWRKTSRVPARERARLEEAWAAEQARPAKERNPVATYRALCQMLRRKS